MEERIKYLFRQYLNNTCTKEEFEEFLSYFNHAAHNELIRELIQKAYEETGLADPSRTYVDERGQLVLTKPASLVQPIKSKLRHLDNLWRIAIAAIVVGLLAGLGSLIIEGWHQSKTAPIQVLAKKITHRSEYKYLVLPDSTQVWLNAASTLEYPNQFAPGKREVYLTGEAFFDVKHASKQPFLIHTGKVTTLVLGTAFNIKAYPGRENIIVSVSRGKVRVNYEEKEVATLTPGQQVKVSNNNNTAVQKNIAVTVTAPWQQGNLVYDDETLNDIIADLERMYDVTIRLQNTTLGKERISTSFTRETGIESALQLLCNLTDTRLKQVNNTYVIE